MRKLKKEGGEKNWLLFFNPSENREPIFFPFFFPPFVASSFISPMYSRYTYLPLFYGYRKAIIFYQASASVSTLRARDGGGKKEVKRCVAFSCFVHIPFSVRRRDRNGQLSERTSSYSNTKVESGDEETSLGLVYFITNLFSIVRQESATLIFYTLKEFFS